MSDSRNEPRPSVNPPRTAAWISANDESSFAVAQGSSQTVRSSHPTRGTFKDFGRRERARKIDQRGVGNASLPPTAQVHVFPASASASSSRDGLAGEQTATTPSQTALPTFSKFRLFVNNNHNAVYPSTRRHPSDEAVLGQRAMLLGTQLPRQISESALDPFFRSPLTLSVPDQHLMQLYLSTVPHATCGASTGTVAMGVQHAHMSIMSTNDIVVMWLLLVFEVQVASFQSTERLRRMSILARRSGLYSLLTSRLSDGSAASTDDYILAVAVGAGCEYQLGKMESARVHGRAARKLLELRGGIKAIREMRYATGLVVTSAFVDLGVDGLFKTRETLHERLTVVSRLIRDVQAWNFDIRSSALRDIKEAFDDRVSAGSDYGIDSHPLIAGHLKRRARAFEPGTALFNHASLPRGELDSAQCRFHLSILFAMNMALYAFRDSGRTTKTYLKGLTTAANMNAPDDPAPQPGKTRLPSLILILVIAHTAVDLEERNEVTSTVFHIDSVVEFVEMIMSCSPKSKLDVLNALVSWLMAPMTSPGEVDFVSNPKLDILAQEVESKWAAEQSESL